jgi:N-hydroxyarylamine O-acetyltransferase
MDVKAYLERIQYQGVLLPTFESLQGLQLSHLLSVPFENLSIHANEPILLQEEALFDKIVLRRRGGFCYELNGLFAALLRLLGFNVTMLSAGVAKAAGGFGPEFDHMTLMVSLEDRWLVDVGFGDTFRQPLLIDRRDAQLQGERSYQIDDGGNYLLLQESQDDSGWKPQYRFTLQSHELVDFAEMCHYHQTSSESSFTQRRICSLARPDGRVTLSDMRLIETKGSERREQVLSDEEEVAAILVREFGIVMK